MKRFTLRKIHGAVWAVRALLQARRQLRDGNFMNVRISAPPGQVGDLDAGVYAVLRRLPSTCLERSIVLQRLLSSRDRAADVVIGVARSNGKYHAHAWLEGEPVGDNLVFHELVRLPAP
jgi:hypothetical protein